MFRIKNNLIFLYAENARMKINEVARLLKNSSQRIKYSLNMMEKEGILYQPYCIFDYSFFGLVLFRVYFKGAYIGEKDKSDIIKKLAENNYIIAIYELSGEFDLVIEILAPNPSRFNKILKSISDLMPTLRNYKIILNLVTHIYPMLYLTKDEFLYQYVPTQIVIGGDRKVEDFNKKEMSIMQSILSKPKFRMTKLASESNLNIKTTKSILQNLKKRNIIRGFRYILDANKLGIHKFRLFIKLHNLNKEREESLMSYLLITKEIVQAHKTVGDWDLEIDIESFDKARIRKLTIEMRETFKDIIETFNIMEFYHYYKKSYLPKYIFKKENITFI